MISPAALFAGERYVSDVLERLLDAGEAREAVRSYAVHLLDDSPARLRAAVEPAATYVGGKCMGYPAIWFLHLLTGEERIEDVVERSAGALCLSLSTSIVDDLADHDETLGSEYLAYLYVLLGEAMARASDPQLQRRLHAALEQCLDSDAPCASRASRGDRIGAFFSLVALQALRGYWSATRSELGIEATRRFGRFCAHVDDAMDARRDLENGVAQNVVLQLLREHLGRPPRDGDLLVHRSWIDPQVGSLLIASLDEVLALVNEIGAQRAATTIGRLQERLEDWPPRL